MKTKILVLSFISFLSLNITIFPQGEAAVPFLLINPSPSLSAMGSTGTALPTDDPFGFLWNPAQLGHTSQTNNLSFIFYPSKIDWLGLDLIELNSLAFNAGYNFKDLVGVPLSLGFGYSKVKFDFGEIAIIGPNGPEPLRTYESEDYYNAYSFGLCFDFGAQLSIGYTIKNVTSFMGDFSPHPDSGEIKAKNTVNDFGILLNIPVLKLINDQMLVDINEKITAFPRFDFSLGYSKSNIGDSVQYSNIPQSDPLPRMARLGYGISTGFDLAVNDFRFNAFNLSFTVVAEDILISRGFSQSGQWKYEDDLDFWKNVILIKGSDNVVSHAGTKLDFAETFSYSFGHFSGWGFDERKTYGFELKAKGLLKLIAMWTENSVTDFIRDHLDIRYYNANYFVGHELDETKMTGLAIYIHNLSELF
ncbi:MAG: hypothetical protein B6D44_13040 [Ignavibacteriales bacterium UTCHB2]|jgi:hypothetical protein|nr:MAG: hypothetical protein BWY38_01012 [Ignavibacteria bacterium ADurb.Bin266]OQY71369.1 MAG: hypothetical protein B6D44_13040 [Ignavibacteriales bacterium UTCHB2]HQI40769.1 hypothetical protein [Ignavibacteriaceae bacterium]